MLVHALHVMHSVSGKGGSASVRCMGADLEGALEGFGQGGRQRASATNGHRWVVNNGPLREGSRTAGWAAVAGIRFVAWVHLRRLGCRGVRLSEDLEKAGVLFPLVRFFVGMVCVAAEANLQDVD